MTGSFAWTLIARVYSVFFIDPFMYNITTVGNEDGWGAVGKLGVALLLGAIIVFLWLVPFQFKEWKDED